MDYLFTQFETGRYNLLKMMRDYSLHDLNTIPEGFSNSIFWNMAHIVVTQQLLHYYLSGNDMYIDSFWVDHYKKGTTVVHSVDENTKEDLIELLARTTSQLAKDYRSGIFSNYKAYPTSFGVTLNTIEEAIAFNNIHEGIHYGYILAMQKSM